MATWIQTSPPCWIDEVEAEPDATIQARQTSFLYLSEGKKSDEPPESPLGNAQHSAGLACYRTAVEFKRPQWSIDNDDSHPGITHLFIHFDYRMTTTPGRRKHNACLFRLRENCPLRKLRKSKCHGELTWQLLNCFFRRRLEFGPWIWTQNWDSL